MQVVLAYLNEYQTNYTLKFLEGEWDDGDFVSDGVRYHNTLIFENELKAREALWNRLDESIRSLQGMQYAVLYSRGENTLTESATAF